MPHISVSTSTFRLPDVAEPLIISASKLLVTGKCGIEFDTSQHGQRDLVFPLFFLGLACFSSVLG